MGYRGEDVPARGDWGRQTPWQPSSGAAPGSTGAWDDGPRGYTDEEGYPPRGGAPGYGPDGGYPGQGQQAYPPHGGQYGDAYQQPYGQQPQGQYGGYGPEQGQSGTGGYAGPPGYPQPNDYGYGQGQHPASGYGQAGYDQPPYDHPGYDQPAPGYGQGGGYQDPAGGYDQTGGYPAPPASGGYPAARGGSGGYPALPPAGHGGYPALPAGHGGYSEQDAGNDWYGGQPAAANGASFADTGTYRLNGRVIDEYGTGPREALHDPVRGYQPGQGTGPLPGQGTGSLPGQGSPAGPGLQPFQPAGPQSVRETRAQQQYDDRAAYPDGDRPRNRAGDTSGGYPVADKFGAPGYDAYDEAPPPSAAPAGDGYNDDYGDGYGGPDANDDPYQERYGDGAATQAAGAGRRPGKPADEAARGPLGGKRLLFAALGVVAVGIIGVAAYVFLFNSNSTAGNAGARSLSTVGATPSTQACVQQLGTYCHIEAATDDPTPLTITELFPPAISDETDKTSYSLVATKVDKTCSNAVIGSTLIQALKTGKCTQVLRGSYVSGDSKIMGTIGVVNLSTTNEAHYAGKDVGDTDFIAPLTSAKGVASKLGKGTGVVESHYKGHYLILSWSQFVNGTDPTTKAEQDQLEQFCNDLVAETANADLSQRMVTGTAPTPAASS